MHVVMVYAVPIYNMYLYVIKPFILAGISRD